METASAQEEPVPTFFAPDRPNPDRHARTAAERGTGRPRVDVRRRLGRTRPRGRHRGLGVAASDPHLSVSAYGYQQDSLSANSRPWGRSINKECSRQTTPSCPRTVGPHKWKKDQHADNPKQLQAVTAARAHERLRTPKKGMRRTRRKSVQKYFYDATRCQRIVAGSTFELPLLLDL